LRVLSALVLGPLVLLCVWQGDLWFACLIAVVAVAGGAEWRKMARLEARGIGTILIMAPLFVLIAVVGANPAAGLFVLGVAVFLALATFGSPWKDRRWAIAALVHIGLATLALIYLRQLPETGRDLVFMLLGAVWLSDIGGYVAGRLIGGPKLAPQISPNKTLAGSAGSLAFVLAGALLYGALTGGDHRSSVLIVALVLSVATQAGDLFESWAKRSFGVKDSGTLIPGHGGVLDRVDGLLFAAPVLALFVLVWGAELTL
jgi:phosphatidate cytidylyltransferase